MRRSAVTLFLLCNFIVSVGQPIPSPEEKIPFACTFAKDSDKEWGDDDFVQIFFFAVPESYTRPVYIRVFDPETGGMYDENHNVFNSKTKFSVYAGAGCHSDAAAQGCDPVGNFKSGILLTTRTFSNETKFDNKWIALGPFNPADGELQPQLGGRVFKVVIEGLEGDDGNLYRLFLSSSGTENRPVEGGNGFAYEYTFRLEDSPGSVSHLYPFIPEKVTAVKVKIFDYDNEGVIRIISVARRGYICQLEESGLWIESRYRISKPEINTSIDVQFIKKHHVKNNNIVVFITNQYGEAMPFFTSPIGGIPKYTYKIGVKVEDDTGE
jgi:hypothetical protein